MSTLYLDTSALVKRYITELGSRWLAALLDREPAPVVLTSRLTTVEGVCTLARLRREGLLSRPDYSRVLAALDYDLQYRYDLIGVELAMIEAARQMVDRHPLRAYDAVQLATAWLANQELIRANLPPLTFISADDRLLQIAQAEGLSVENPNDHP